MSNLYVPSSRQPAPGDRHESVSRCESNLSAKRSARLIWLKVSSRCGPWGAPVMAVYVLVGLVAALVIYLFYAVIHPEKF